MYNRNRVGTSILITFCSFVSIEPIYRHRASLDSRLLQSITQAQQSGEELRMKSVFVLLMSGCYALPRDVHL